MLFLQEKTGQSDLKIEALLFLKLAMLKSDPKAYQPHLLDLSEPIFVSVQERYYKVCYHQPFYLLLANIC